MRKILFYITLICLLLLLSITIIYFNPKSNISNRIKSFFPLELRKEISTFLNTTIFLLPELDKRVKMAEYEIRNIKNEITYQQGIINQNTIYKLDNFKKDTLSEFYSREIYDK